MTKKEAGFVRFGISIPGEPAARFDSLVAKAACAYRSRAVRDLIRDRLAAAAWAAGKSEMVGTFSMVRDHHVREPGDALTEPDTRSLSSSMDCEAEPHIPAHIG